MTVPLEQPADGTTPIEETHNRPTQPSDTNRHGAIERVFSTLGQGYQRFVAPLLKPVASAATALLAPLWRVVEPTPVGTFLKGASDYLAASTVRQVAALFALGDTALFASGMTTPGGEGKSNSPDKMIAGQLGLANSLVWLAAREYKTVDRALADFSVLCEQATVDGQLNVQQLEALVHPKEPLAIAREKLQENAERLGSGLMALSSFFLARSGHKRKSLELTDGAKFNGGISEQIHGLLNLTSYSILAAVPSKQGPEPEYDWKNPKDWLEFLQYRRSQICSAIDTATTATGFITGTLDLLGRKVPVPAALLQLFGSSAYVAGSLKLSGFDEEKRKARMQPDGTLMDNDQFVAHISHEAGHLLSTMPAYRGAAVEAQQEIARLAREYVATVTGLEAQDVALMANQHQPDAHNTGLYSPGA
jgi:hypothetical protein